MDPSLKTEGGARSHDALGGCPRRRGVSAFGKSLGVLLLLTLFAAQSVLSMRYKSVTVDEIMYIASGYYHLSTGDFRLNMTNPPLMKMIGALPLLWLRPDLPQIEGDPANLSLIEQWRFSRRFLFGNRVDADRMLFLARLPVVVVGMFLGLYVFRFGRELYGATAGLFALLLYSFSPNMLAHARLVTHDLGVSAFMFIAAYYFWHVVRGPTARSIVFCGVFTGLSLLCKTTGAFLFPIFGLFALTVVWRGERGAMESFPGRFPGVRRFGAGGRCVLAMGLTLGLIAIIAIVVLDAGYGFQDLFEPYRPTALTCPNGASLSWKCEIRRWLGALPLPLPGPFVHMVRFQSQLTATTGRMYFLGKLHDALWYLPMVTVLIKTPIALLVLWIAAGVKSVVRLRTVRVEWLFAIFVTVIMLLFCVLSDVNVGLRYLLPIYPCAHVWISGLLSPRDRAFPKTGYVVLGLAMWYIVASVGVHPHYLAFFNRFVGGPRNGYRCLTDSNLDWGQDLKGLKAYMDKNGIDRIKLGYFGSADASYYGIDYDYLPSVGLAPTEPGQLWWYEMSRNTPQVIEPQTGTIAISATLLASPSWMEALFGGTYDWLDGHEPVDQIGHSMLIFRVDEKDAP